MKKLGIVVPAHNEEKRIERTLKDYSKYFEEERRNKSLDYKLLIVINKTTDKTKDIVLRYKKKNSRIDFLDLSRGGKGNAVIQGFKRFLEDSSYDFIGFVDADMSTGPKELHRLVLVLEKKSRKIDGIIASRYLKGAKVKPKPTFARIISSRLFNSAIRSILLMPYKDTQCGAKIFTKRSLNKVINSIGMTYWAFDLDLLYNLRKKGFKIREEPTLWSDREYSKINFLRSGPWMMLAVIRLRILNSPLRRGIRIYDTFIKYMPKF